jgi:ribosomal protein S18 acetylase RimI-like enzyme
VGISLLIDAADIRARLEGDRTWAAFSLADLDPPLAERATWFGQPRGRSVVLIYDAYDPPIVICHGDAGDCDAILADDDVRRRSQRAYVNVTDDQLDVALRHFSSFDRRRMLRMRLDMPVRGPGGAIPVHRLGPADLPAVRTLYTEDPPAFFLPAQLEQGVYYGARAGDELVAIAGTHVVSAASSVAAIGNVYTRRDWRGRGLAGDTTRAVSAQLQRMAIRTIVLNVASANDVARRVYERIGFHEYCVFYEGQAQR